MRKKLLGIHAERPWRSPRMILSTKSKIFKIFHRESGDINDHAVDSRQGRSEVAECVRPGGLIQRSCRSQSMRSAFDSGALRETEVEDGLDRQASLNLPKFDGIRFDLLRRKDALVSMSRKWPNGGCWRRTSLPPRAARRGHGAGPPRSHSAGGGFHRSAAAIGARVALDVEDIRWTREGMVLNIRVSKTDPEGRGIEVGISVPAGLGPVRFACSKPGWSL